MYATGTEVRDESGALLGWLDFLRPPEVAWAPLTIPEPGELDWIVSGAPPDPSQTIRVKTLRPVRWRRVARRYGIEAKLDSMVWKVSGEHELECLKTLGGLTPVSRPAPAQGRRCCP